MANNKNVNARQLRFETNHYGLLYGKKTNTFLQLKSRVIQGFVSIFVNVACMELFNSRSMAHRTRICEGQLQSCWRVRFAYHGPLERHHRCNIDLFQALHQNVITIPI